MSAPILQCMGGFCHRRDVCAHYWAPEIPGREPVERLCAEADQPERIQRDVTEPAEVVGNV